MIENPKNANISNKVKTNSGFHCSAFLFHASSRRLFSVLFELGNLGTKVCQSSPTQRSGFQFSCFCLGVEVGSWSWVWFWCGPVRSGSDAGELVPEAGRQDALHLLHDEIQGSKQRAEELQGRQRTTVTNFNKVFRWSQTAAGGRLTENTTSVTWHTDLNNLVGKKHTSV